MNSPAFFTVFCAIIVKDKFKGGSSMKKILLIVMMLVMCVSSACFASDGSVLDAEANGRSVFERVFLQKCFFNFKR